MKLEINTQKFTYTPRTLSITFESALEEEAFRTMCGFNATVASKVFPSPSSNEHKQKCLENMLGSMYRKL